ncbi:uncharacterized protein LOC133529518 isoform X2 [Cydia pomonella]|uniref:uncharacterized protein LOC133529518 isoform X2 n=1 Tax=Cydia pomonella TaxID=82600 RepID=UPI002ADD60EB|nr:uncharacterized protein LOC133529518 isoform X2 [Cydia pomonella]
MYLLILLVCGLTLASEDERQYCGGRYSHLCLGKGQHVACQFPVAGSGPNCQNYSRIRFTAELRNVITNFINKRRQRIAAGHERVRGGKHIPTPQVMMFVEWDVELARLAQRLADQCYFVHDECRATVRYPYAGQSVGEVRWRHLSDNYELSAQRAIRRVFDAWWGERRRVEPHQLVKPFRISDKGLAWGHFSQLAVWTLRAVGCGAVRHGEDYPRLLLVCDFSHTNMLGEKTIIPGEPGPCPEHTRRKARSNFPLLCASEPSQTETNGKRKQQNGRNAVEKQQQKLLTTAVTLLRENKKEMNSFRMYVGETLERISPDQREIAEKLISEVLFLARRNKLTSESKIDAYPRHAHHSHVHQYNPSHYVIQSPFSAKVTQLPHSSFNVSFNPLPQPETHHRILVYAPQTTQRVSSPTVYSPTHVRTQPPPSSPSFHPTPVTYSPHHIQSHPTPSQTQIPNPSPPFHLSQNMPITYSPHYIQLLPTPGQTQIPNPWPSFYLSQNTLITNSPHHILSSPTPTQTQIPISSPSFHLSQNTPVTYSPLHIESPPSPTQTPNPSPSFHPSQNTATTTSSISYTLRVQSPPNPTQMQTPASLSPVIYSPIHSQVSHPYTQPPTLHVPEPQDDSSTPDPSDMDDNDDINDDMDKYSDPSNEVLKKLSGVKK